MRCLICAAVLATATLTAGVSHAGLWKCVRADGTVLFQDGGGLGCREVGAMSDVQSTRFPGRQSGGERPPMSSPIEALPPQDPTAAQELSVRPFVPASRTVPAVSYHDLSPALRAKGWNIPNKGDIQLLQIDVSYLPAGNGPLLSTDHHFLEEARQAFGLSVLAAAKATRYDPRFLKVHVTIPMVPGSFHSGTRVDGPSAGAMWAVAVTSAILGDPVRQDLCFSGTIDMNLAVGPVGGLEHKIEGCHLLPQFHELMLPAGQRTFMIADKGMARSMKVTEVSTLAEAYEIATGQPLRSAQ